MRNARKVTRRRSVNGGPPGRASRAAHRRFRRWLRQQQQRQLRLSSSGGGKLDVVGYSTPESVYPEALEPAFEKTSAGQGRQLQQLLRRLRRPEPRGRRRPARLGRPLLPGRRHGTAGRRRRTRLQRLGKAALRRHRHRLGRRDPRPQGQPGGDQVLRRPAEQGRRRRHPEPVQLRLGPLEHHGRLRHRDQRGQVARPGAGSGQDRARKDRRPAGQRPRRARRLHPGRGRRPAQLRERGDQGRKGRRRRRIRRSRPRRSRSKPRSRSPRSAPEPAAEDFLKFLWSDEGQELWAENGYRPVNPKLVDPKQFPTPKDLFKISQFGGWGKVNDEFFDEETGSVAKIENELGVSTSG